MLDRRRLLTIAPLAAVGAMLPRPAEAAPRHCRDLQAKYDALKVEYDAVCAAHLESVQRVRDFLATHLPDATVDHEGDPAVPLVLVLTAPPPPTENPEIPESTTHTMAWSQSQTRPDGVTLSDGSLIYRAAHIYLPTVPSGASVAWSVDGVAVGTRTQTPYDLMGSDNAGYAWPYRTSSLSEGSHQFKAIITFSDGTQEQVTRNLTVRNYPTNPTIVNVTAGSFTSLQNAINNASGNTKIVVPAGTYSGRLVLPAKSISISSPVWIAFDPGVILDGGAASDNASTLLIRGGGYIIDGGRANGDITGAIIRDTWRPVESPSGVTVTDLWIRGGIRVQNAGAEAMHFRENITRLVMEDVSINGTGLAATGNAESVYLGTNGKSVQNTIDVVMWNVRCLSYAHEGIEVKDGCVNTTMVDCYANGQDAQISGRDQYGTASFQTKGQRTRWLRCFAENAAWHAFFNYSGSYHEDGTEYRACNATARADNTQGYGYKMDVPAYLSPDSTSSGFPLGHSN